MVKLEVTPAAAFTEYKELNFEGLYLYHTYGGPKANQIEIVDNKAPINMGATAVNNWEVYDGPGSDANLVAHAQGLHTHVGNWTWVNYFSLVFVNEKFSGSTLEVMGKAVENGEWAVVGGTGQFAMANGVIYKKIHEQRSHGNVIQLTIRAFCPVLKGTTEIQYPITKVGPYGGSGSGVSLMDITETPRRLESITVYCNGVVNSIAFSYIDNSGQKRSTGRWGGPDGAGPNKAELVKSEVVTGVFGTFLKYDNKAMITSIKFVTNLDKIHGPWGKGGGDPFTITAEPGKAIVGFFVRSNAEYLEAIGAYVRRL